MRFLQPKVLTVLRCSICRLRRIRKKGMSNFFLSLILVAIFLAAGISTDVAAQTGERVFAQTSRSVLVVKNLKAQGSGVAVGYAKSSSQETYLIVATNCHVIGKETSSSELSRNNQVIGRGMLVFADPARDLCLLAVAASGIPIVKIRDANTLKVGERVFSVGAPRGLELSIAEGVVSQLRGERMAAPLVQTTAAISPGSSGGGLFDAQGLLVGLTSMYLGDSQGLNFAIPSEWIGERLDSVRDKIATTSSPVILTGVQDFSQDKKQVQCKSTLLIESEGADTYLDECEVSRSGKYVFAWILINFKIDAKTGNHLNRSMRSKDSYDCAAGRSANVGYALYAASMGLGSLLLSQSVPESEWKYEDAIPGSPNSKILSKVCSLGA